MLSFPTAYVLHYCEHGGLHFPSIWSWFWPRCHEVLVSVSYTLVSWSHIDLALLLCNYFSFVLELCPVNTDLVSECDGDTRSILHNHIEGKTILQACRQPLW